MKSLHPDTVLFWKVLGIIILGLVFIFLLVSVFDSHSESEAARSELKWQVKDCFDPEARKLVLSHLHGPIIRRKLKGSMESRTYIWYYALGKDTGRIYIKYSDDDPWYKLDPDVSFDEEWFMIAPEYNKLGK